MGLLGFHPGLFRQVSGKMDLGYQISKFPGFSEFPMVAQLEQPLETKMQEYRCSDSITPVLFDLSDQDRSRLGLFVGMSIILY